MASLVPRPRAHLTRFHGVFAPGAKLKPRAAAALRAALGQEASGARFEYRGRQLDDPNFSHDEEATSGVSFTFPTEYLLERGPGHLRTLALELARELPFSFGSLVERSPPGL